MFESKANAWLVTLICVVCMGALSIVTLPAADLAIVVSDAWPSSIVPKPTAVDVDAVKFVAVAALPVQDPEDPETFV